MKRMGFALVLFGWFVLAFCAVVSAQEPHAHEHASTSTPVPAVRWATDAALREGMHRVHGALDQLHRYELGQLPQSAALASVTEIDAAANFMFANCKLDPTPDQALHGMLASLLAGAAALKQNPKDMAAVASMRNAVADYPRYFNDPGYAEAEAAGDAQPKH